MATRATGRGSTASSPGRCGYAFDGTTCRKAGSHFCEPRAEKVVKFFAEALVHTKGDWARSAFELEDWQADDIIRPIFGTVRWDVERRRYVRQFQIAWIEIARKNGKSELAAGLVLYLLTSDDEFSAEIYGAAKTTKQAGKVSEVVDAMRKLTPKLDGDHGGRIKFNKNERRMSDVPSSSYYDVIASDDPNAELGHNPHGVVVDEFLAQAYPDFYSAMRTAMGARSQPLMILLTTAGNDPASFGAKEHDEMLRIAEDPGRAPHVFVYIRALPRTDDELASLRARHAGHPDLPVSTDPFDERNWRWSNPALGSFLSIESLRHEALEARNDPTKENPFRQFRANQWVSQVSRWMPLHLWDATAGIVDEDELAGRPCYAGLDLASTTDLAAWVLLFPPASDDDPYDVLWRFWTPEAQLAHLDDHTGGRATVWARQGLLYATEGDWIDYEGDPETGMSTSSIIGRDFPSIHHQISQDAKTFRILKVGYDQREATSTAQHIAGLGLELEPIYQGFGLSGALKEVMRLTKAERLRHGGHPVARWNVDSAEVKTNDEERIKLVKPARQKTGKRVDGVAALADAIRAEQLSDAPTSSSAEAYLEALAAGR